MFDSRTITTKLRHALSTGNWSGTLKGDYARLGVAQALKRDVNHFATMSYLRKCVAPVPYGSKITEPRLLHNTHYGLICPSETPEGEKIGLLKSLAFMSKVSSHSNGDDLKETLNYLFKEGSLIAYNSGYSI
jgi:DNA-directed RNA polymerase II subunit RPB2